MPGVKSPRVKPRWVNEAGMTALAVLRLGATPTDAELAHRKETGKHPAHGGITQQELARRAGLRSRTSVADAEQRGRRLPTRKVMESLASALGVSLAELGTDVEEGQIGWRFEELFDLFREWEAEQCRRNAPGSQPLKVDTIAIDLADGWEFISNTVASVVSPRIEFNIFMLDGPSGRLDFGPQERAASGLNPKQFEAAAARTRGWSNSAPGYLAELNREVYGRTLGGGDGKKSVKVTVRLYRTIPTVHGVCAAVGQSKRVAVTRCRFPTNNPTFYDWGKCNYLFFASDRDAFKAGTRDWDKRLKELEKTASPPVLVHDWDCPS